jgi:hypothetical protein
MRESARELCGYHVRGTDGPAGKLDDLLFDDQAWVVRHLVVSVGPRLAGHRVLVSPGTFRRADPDSSSVHLKLTRAEVRASPHFATHAPVSRWRAAAGRADLPGWPSPWIGYAVWGPAVYPPVLDVDARAESAAHLFGVRDLIGYRFSTRRGELGRIRDFVLEDTTFAIECLVAEVRRGHSDRTLPVLPRQVVSIDRLRRIVTADLGRKAEEDDVRAGDLARTDAQSL